MTPHDWAYLFYGLFGVLLFVVCQYRGALQRHPGGRKFLSIVLYGVIPCVIVGGLIIAIGGLMV